MRKFLAILLAVLMVVPAFAFTTSAEETTPAENLNIIPLITEWDMPDEDMDPDQLSAWRGPNGGKWNATFWTAQTGTKAVGRYSAADKAVVRNWTGVGTASPGWVTLGYQYFKPIDLSGIWDTGAICFDLYLSDPDALGADTVTYDFELRSPGGNDDNEWNAKNGALKNYPTLSQLYGGDLQAGWNHFEIPLTYFGLVDKADDGKTPDNTQIHYFRLLNNANVSFGGEGENKIMMKNIYFVDQCVYEPYTAPEAQIVEVWDTTSTTTAAGNSVTVKQDTVYPNGLMDVDGDGDLEFAVIHAKQSETTLANYGLVGMGGGWNDGNYGVKNNVSFGSTPFDSSENLIGIRFELFVSDTAVDADGTLDTLNDSTAYVDSIMDETWIFELSSSGTSDYQEIAWGGTLQQIFGYQLVPGQWNTVVLMFNSCTQSTLGDAAKRPDLVGDFDKNNFNYFRMYNADGDIFTFTGDLTIAMQNFEAIRLIDEETPANQTAVHRIEDDNGSSTNCQWFLPSDFCYVPTTNNARNQAVLAEHFQAGVQDKHTGGNWGTRTGYLSNFAAIDTTGMDTICFDLFINYYGTASLETMLANTWDNVTMDGTSSPKVDPYQIEISSGGTSDRNEHALNTSLAKLTGIAKDSITSLDDVNGWHHVEIPLDDFHLSTASQYTPDGEQYGNGEKYLTDWTAINFFCLWLNGPYTAADGVNLMLAVDNLYFKDSTYVAPEAPKPAITFSATPALTNSFNLTCEIGGNELIVSNPIVDVTFDGQTTTHGADFGFNGILAHRLSDTITTTVTALNADHQLMQSTLTYSIKQYAKNWLGSGDTTLNRLLSDMLYYGAAAQTLIGYNTDNLASDVEGILTKTAVTAETLNASKIATVFDGDAAENGPAWRSAALVLDSELAIRFAFTGTPESVTIGEETFGTEDFVVADGYSYIDFPVSANHFDVVYKAYFNGDASYCLNYSVNHYLATKYTAEGPLTDLLAAIYNYGVSADAYADATNQND